MSADGQRIVFVSGSTNLVPGETNKLSDIFIRDLAAGTTTRLSNASPEVSVVNSPKEISLSPDGRIVGYGGNTGGCTGPNTPRQRKPGPPP